VPAGLPLIDLRNVTLMRGDTCALRNVNLTIEAREHVAILGPNGCGKSTLIKTITRDCYPQASPGSSVSIMGESVWNVFDLRKLLGIVSNDLMTQCTREFTGFDIVLSGFFSSIGIWPNNHVTGGMRARASEVLDFLEASHLSGKPVDEMSSGEARRMLIGRALVHEPKALLLDRPQTGQFRHRHCTGHPSPFRYHSRNRPHYPHAPGRGGCRWRKTRYSDSIPPERPVRN
jgi:iron complex transport system ATP-binding protein